MKERLQKIISDCGAASRRQAEKLIAEGRVTVNGKVAAVGMKADVLCDIIKLDGNPLEKDDKRVYIMLNKPRGYICTMKDERGRKTVVELVSDCGVRVYPVGRLDANSEGLLLLTNDGEFTNAMTHPSHKVSKVYTVRVEGGDIAGSIARLEDTVQLEDGPARAKAVRMVSDDGERAVVEISVAEGRKHLVRNMCAAVGLDVKRLIRIAEGGLELGRLGRGKWRYLTEGEVKKLKKFI